MSTLDSLYGAGIASQGVGQGLQGLVEGYRLKRELDNQQLMGNSMAMYRNMMGNAAMERGDNASAHADVLQKQLDNMNKGLKPDGSPATAPGNSNPAGILTALQKTPYGSDPAQLLGAFNALSAGKPLPPFVQRAPAAAAPAAPAQPGIMDMLGGKIRGMLGGAPAAPAQVAPSPVPANPPGMGAPTPVQTPASPLPAAGGAPGAPVAGAYNWRSALKPQPQPQGQ